MENVYLPLAILKDTTKEIPQIWESIDISRRMLSQTYKWPDRCFAPIEAVTIPFAAYMKVAKKKDVILPIPVVALALAQWRKDKEVFVIDKTLEEILYEQQDTDISTVAFDYLPYSCFYVECTSLKVYSTEIDGYFFFLSWDSKSKKEILNFVFLSKLGVYNAEIPFENGNLSQFLDDSIERMLKSKNEKIRAYGQKNLEQKDGVFHLLKCALQIVLYLCACNAEIVPDPEQKTIMKRSSTIKDRYAEIKKWDVGFRIGASFRAQAQSIQRDDVQHAPGSATQKRPHIRRGHWHHFWTGSKKEGSERKLILKWLPPIFVGASDAEMPVTIHPVK